MLNIWSFSTADQYREATFLQKMCIETVGTASLIAVVPVAIITGIISLALLSGLALTHPFAYSAGILLDALFDKQQEAPSPALKC